MSEFVKDDLANWQARKIREHQPPRINLNLSLAERKERDELLILLRKVKQFWVKGVLENSIHRQALIELGKEAWTQTGQNPWEQILELPDQTNQTLPPGERIDEVFDELGHSLLILGAPGSGKTITLLDLASALIVRAEDDPAQPIPVVFNLSSWTDPRQDLLDWLVGELRSNYQVPKKIARRWLEENWILPLLDGLDEVIRANQTTCVESINTYIDNHGAPGLAVCSRLKDYTDLPARLNVSGAIRLQPLTHKQVVTYVARSGEALAGLHTALDRDPVLQSLAKTPLMLDVMSLAYRDMSAGALASQSPPTEETRRSHLFETYVSKMLKGKGKGAQLYTSDQTLGWLSWLARGMQHHGQTVFLIEQLQPSWLETCGQYAVYTLGSRMVFGLMFGLILLAAGLSEGLIYGLIFGLVPGLIDQWRMAATIPSVSSTFVTDENVVVSYNCIFTHEEARAPAEFVVEYI